MRELIRVSRGPIALLLIHGADEWANVFESNGLTVSRGVCVYSSLDLVVGAAGPIKIDFDDTLGLRELIEELTQEVTDEGEDVLVPFAGVSATAMAIQSAGRQPIILPLSASHAEQIRADFAGDHVTAPLDDETYASVVTRLDAGEPLYSIARALGIGSTRLRHRLLRDGLPTRAGQKVTATDAAA
ncbi:MAG: hypothetical protein QM754_06990 [Tepidisphaeraceae bacterium]